MKVGVIGDTHLVGGGLGFRKIASQVVSKEHHGFEVLRQVAEKHFKGKVERILHAGDLVDEDVIALLEEYARVDAVAGNMDGADLKSRLPIKRLLELEGHRIGLIHGWGAPTGIVERIRKEFENVEAVVFGHTHAPMNELVGGILFFNPGSAIDRRFAPFRSIGILDVTKEKISGEIIGLE